MSSNCWIAAARDAGVCLLRRQELTIPVDQHERDDGEEDADEDGAHGVGVEEPVA